MPGAAPGLEIQSERDERLALLKHNLVMFCAWEAYANVGDGINVSALL